MSIVVRPEEIKNLVPMPESVLRLNEMAFDPEISASEVSRVIELDVALTADVLRWANSSWSASQITIVTIKDAVVRFGITNIVRLAIGKHIAKPMKEALPGYRLGEQELWCHSVAAALATECLSQVLARPVPTAAFAAALLHDVGKLFLTNYLDPEAQQRIGRIMQDERVTYYEAENRVLGINHAQVGGMIAEMWKLPDMIRQAIEHHHDCREDFDDLLDTVQIANAITKLLGIGLGSEEMNMEINDEAASRLGLTAADVDNLCALVNYKLQEAMNLWGIVA